LLKAYGVREILIILSIALGLIFLQSTLIASIFPRLFFTPNLMLLLVVFVSFYSPGYSGAVLVFILGILFDFSSGLLLGPWAASFMGVFILISFISQRILIETAPASFVVVLLCSLLASVVYSTLVFEVSPTREGIFWILPLEALVNAVLAVPVFALLRKSLPYRFRGSAAGR
jgi:rod shape-determining protein MreD